MEVTLEVQGLKKIQRAAEKVVNEIAKSGKLVARAVMVLEHQIKMNATGRPGPRIQTGRLRASIVPEVISPILARVGTNVYYSSFVEFGHRQEVGRFVPLYGIRRIGKGEFKGMYEVSQGLGLRLVNPTAPAYPFFGPAIEQTKGRIHGVLVEFGNELGTEWVR